MKNKKLVATVIGAALLANLAVVSMASAADSNADVTVNGGSLSFVFNPNLQFASGPVTMQSYTTGAVYPADSLKIIDNRGTVGTWGLSVMVTDWQGQTLGNTWDNTLTRIETDADDTLTAINSSNCTLGITQNRTTPTNFSDSNDTGANGAYGDQSNDMSIITGDSRLRIAECRFEPHLETDVPARMVPDTYMTTLTWTMAG